MKPNCPTCHEGLSTGASQNGKPKFFCVNRECEDRFKVIDDPTRSQTTSETSTKPTG